MNELRGLWRGKWSINEKWVDGLLVYHNIKRSAARLHDQKYGDDFWVDISTLGQCIGRCDKNNNPIFVGDIVKTKYDTLSLVVWHQSPQFMGFDLKSLDDSPLIEDDIFNHLEVVGNKFDNPEFLTNNREIVCSKQDVIRKCKDCYFYELAQDMSASITWCTFFHTFCSDAIHCNAYINKADVDAKVKREAEMRTSNKT